MTRKALSLATLAAALLLSACGPKSETITKHHFANDISGLKRDTSSKPTVIYKRPYAPSLASYNSFIIDAVQVNYYDPAMKKIDSKDMQKMQDYFRNKLISELRDGGYRITNKPSAGVLRISPTLSGLVAADSDGVTNVATMVASGVVGLPGVFVINQGEVTVETAFRNAATNRIDAVVIDHSRGARFFNDKPWSTWSDVTGSFDNWAEGIRKAVDKAHGK